MKTRILSIILAVALVCALLPTAALAADSDFVIWGGVLVDYVGPGGDVVIPYGVTTIGKHAFPKYTEVTDPNGNPAGSRMEPPDCVITSVTIPNSVTTIEEHAFSFCKNLTSVTIPDSVTTIGMGAFMYCSGLTSVTIGNGVTNIESAAFIYCKSLSSVTIPDSVTSIGMDAFSHCASLTSVTLPSRSTSIEDWAFNGCPNVTFQYYPSQRQWETINVGSPGNDDTIPAAPAVPSKTTASVTQVVPYKYDEVGDFNDGVARVKLNGKWGLVNTAGAEIVSCKYDKLSEFSSGVATAQLDGKLGLIDKTGAEIVPCGSLDLAGLEYRDDAFYNGRLVALKFVRSKRISEEASPIDIYNWIIVDTAGNQIDTGKSMELTYVFGVGYMYNNSAVANAYPGSRDFVGWESSRFKNGYSSLYGGLLDAAGNVIVPEGRYSSVSPFSDGFARVKDENGLWGFVDTTGREVVACQYAEVRDFSEGFARVKDGNGLWGHVDTTGRLVVPCKYKDAKDFTDGKAAVSDRTDQVANGKTVYGWGMVDTSGNLVVPIGQYDVEKDGDRFGYHQGLKATQNSNKWGFVDKAGNPVIPTRYDKVKGFSNGLAAVYVEDSGWGYIDLQGSEVLPCQYGRAREFHDGMVAVDLDGKWGFVRVEGLPTESQSTQTTPSVTPAPTVPTAYASTQTVMVDGKPVNFNAYALKDANGNDTNYIKLRDVADILNGSAAQFQVGWDGSITITTHAAYTPNGTEMVQNFSGNQTYTVSTSPVTVNGAPTNLEAITLTDASGGGYTYFKLRDLGAALGFNVSWDAQTGITIDPNTPYSAND